MLPAELVKDLSVVMKPLLATLLATVECLAKLIRVLLVVGGEVLRHLNEERSPYACVQICGGVVCPDICAWHTNARTGKGDEHLELPECDDR